MAKVRAMVVAMGCVVATIVLGGCNSASPALTGDTTCADFLQAEAPARDALVSKLAIALDRPLVLQPEYRSNVEYNCTTRLNAKMSDIVVGAAPAS